MTDLEKNIAFLAKTVPPDDIYLFGEFAYDSSLYLLAILHDKLDVTDMIEEDDHLNRIVNVIVGYQIARKLNKDITLDLRAYDTN